MQFQFRSFRARLLTFVFGLLVLTQGAVLLAVDTANVFREDVPRPSLSRDAALQNAPEKNSDFFIVPKIIE